MHAKIFTSKPTNDSVQSRKGDSHKVEEGTSVGGMRVLFWGTQKDRWTQQRWVKPSHCGRVEVSTWYKTCDSLTHFSVRSRLAIPNASVLWNMGPCDGKIRNICKLRRAMASSTRLELQFPGHRWNDLLISLVLSRVVT